MATPNVNNENIVNKAATGFRFDDTFTAAAPPPPPPLPPLGMSSTAPPATGLTFTAPGIIAESGSADAAFSTFYAEVKQIEHRDSVLTPKQQIDRLTRPGATYFNLNPFDVLQVDPETPLNEMKQKYRRMSILVHPDKNQDDIERSQKAFDALAKAYKTVENEEGLKRCLEIVEEAKNVVDESMKTKRKQAKKVGQTSIPEDNPEEYKRAVYVQTCKLFADLERHRVEREMKDAHEKKRKAQEEEEEEQQKKVKVEWDKNFEASRSNRVNSWRDWKTGGKKSKGTFRPPKAKPEKR